MALAHHVGVASEVALAAVLHREGANRHDAVHRDAVLVDVRFRRGLAAVGRIVDGAFAEQRHGKCRVIHTGGLARLGHGRAGSVSLAVDLSGGRRVEVHPFVVFASEARVLQKVTRHFNPVDKSIRGREVNLLAVGADLKGRVIAFAEAVAVDDIPCARSEILVRQLVHLRVLLAVGDPVCAELDCLVGVVVKLHPVGKCAVVLGVLGVGGHGLREHQSRERHRVPVNPGIFRGSQLAAGRILRIDARRGVLVRSRRDSSGWLRIAAVLSAGGEINYRCENQDDEEDNAPDNRQSLISALALLFAHAALRAGASCGTASCAAACASGTPRAAAGAPRSGASRAGGSAAIALLIHSLITPSLTPLNPTAP